LIEALKQSLVSLEEAKEDLAQLEAERRALKEEWADERKKGRIKKELQNTYST